MHVRLDTHLMRLFNSEIGDVLLNLEHQTKWVGHTFPYGEPLDEPYARNSLLRIQLEFSSPNQDLKTVGSIVLKKQQTIPDVEGLWYYIYTCVDVKKVSMYQARFERPDLTQRQLGELFGKTDRTVRNWMLEIENILLTNSTM